VTTCDGCRYAEWKRDKAGRLHSDQSGTCCYKVEVPQIPNALFVLPKAAWSYGGKIVRGREWKRPCPCWAAMEEE